MEDVAEKVIKSVLVSTLTLAGLLYWLLPKTNLAKHFKMNETLFVLTYVIGVIFGAVGLFVTFAWPQLIVGLHLWELILIPFVLVYTHWAIIARAANTTDILDEKQTYDVSNSAAVTWAVSIPAMVVLFILYEKGILSGVIWFPSYLFATLLIYSASTLFYFRKA